MKCVFKIKEKFSEKCKALNEMNCINCNFYMTEEAKKTSDEKANKMLNNLPENHQADIAVKYYNGKMPWRTYEG